MIDLEEQLQHHLHSVANRAEPVPDVDAVFEDTSPARRANTLTHRRSWVPAAAAIVMAVIGVVGIVAATDLRSPSTADEPNTTPGSPISTLESPTRSVGVPGVTNVRTSESTALSSTVAERLSAQLAADYPDLQLQEDAIRTTDSGQEVTWVYFLDGDRRLFVVAGPSDLLDTGALRRTPDGFEWPDEAGARTIAISGSGSTIIVRSESIESDGQPRSADDLHAVAALTGELVVTSRAESNGADRDAPASSDDGAVVIPDVVGELTNDAVDQLERLGLSVLVVQSVDPSAASDTVVSMEPAPGTLVPAGTIATVTVASQP